jgi:preprotein translocase subunit Sss1
VAKTPDPHTREDAGERLDRELLELLNELRVALPGVQVLFAFLLVVPFQQSFKSLTAFQENLYFATLLLAAISTALLISPTAFHRAVFRLHQKPRVIEYGTRLTVAGIGFLGLAMTGAITLICDIVFDGTRAAIVAAAMVVLYGWFWFGAGALQRSRSS